MDKKYLCVGGTVLSSDGDEHYISPQFLPSLYKVPHKKCVFLRSNDSLSSYKNLIILRPRSSGNYSLPYWILDMNVNKLVEQARPFDVCLDNLKESSFELVIAKDDIKLAYATVNSNIEDLNNEALFYVLDSLKFTISLPSSELQSENKMFVPEIKTALLIQVNVGEINKLCSTLRKY